MKRILIAAAISTLVGCSAFSPTPCVEKLPLAIPDPEVVSFEPIKVTIIHETNSAQIFAEMKKNKKEAVLYGLTGNDYKALAVNLAKVKDYLILLKKVVDDYRNYYEPAKK
jgi:hypothetical protein